MIIKSTFSNDMGFQPAVVWDFFIEVDNLFEIGRAKCLSASERQTLLLEFEGLSVEPDLRCYTAIEEDGESVKDPVRM